MTKYQNTCCKIYVYADVILSILKTENTHINNSDVLLYLYLMMVNITDQWV
jgi:hypothetical protein